MIEKHHKVSILIPAYNVEKYIFRAIESSLNQTYPYIEIVIVDDGSTDSTWDIIEKYAANNPSIKPYKQSNSGVSNARNNAMQRCSGDYIIFLDSDDWLEADAVRQLMHRVSDDRYLICCDRFFAYLDDNDTISRFPQCKKQDDEIIEIEDALCSEGTGEYNIQSACYKLFSIDVIKRNNLKFSSSISHGEDGLFVFEYLQFCKGIIFVYEPLWNILERPGSATTAPYNSKWLTMIDAIDSMIAIAKKYCGVAENIKNYKVKVLKILMSAFLKNKEVSENDFYIIRGHMRHCIKEYNKADFKLWIFAYLPRNVLYFLYGFYIKIRSINY